MTNLNQSRGTTGVGRPYFEGLRVRRDWTRRIWLLKGVGRRENIEGWGICIDKKNYFKLIRYDLKLSRH